MNSQSVDLRDQDDVIHEIQAPTATMYDANQMFVSFVSSSRIIVYKL